MMCSYNANNDVPSCANKLLAKAAHGQWGFYGCITSDCTAIRDFQPATGHRYSPDAAHASAIALLVVTDTGCGRGYHYPSEESTAIVQSVIT